MSRCFFGILVAKVFPVDPVQPAIAQFDAGFPFEALFGSDLDRQDIGSAGHDEFCDIEFKLVVHTDCGRAIRQLVPIEPDVSPVVDSLKDERVNVATRRRGKRGSIPPVLLPEISRGGKIHAVVEILVNAIFLQDLQNRCGHVCRGVPVRCIEARL